MTSAIDATKPADAVPASKADLRANLAAAKSEITALQAQIGTLSPYVFNGDRNRIINGKMTLDARNAGVAKSIGAGTIGWCTDRWYGASIAGGGIFSVQAITTGGPSTFPTYARITTTTAKVLVPGDAHAFSQAVEGSHWADMLYGSANALPATLSFWVRSSIAGSYAVALVNAASANTYVASYTITVANTWEYKTVTIPGPTIGTWATQTTTAVGVRFDVGSGSNFQGATDVWTATNRGTFVGATSIISTNGATLDITAVQLEPGSVATPWDNRLLASEIILAYRYYQAGAGVRWDGYTSIGLGHSTPVYFTPYMRSTPTVLTNLTSNTNFPVINPTVLATTAAGFAGYLSSTGTGGGLFTFNWSADAEITV